MVKANYHGLALLVTATAAAQNLPPIGSDIEREAAYYEIVDIPVPTQHHIEATSFLELPDGRLLMGTRRGDVFFVSGADTTPPAPRFELFATGLHEVFGLAQREGTIYATQQGEVTRLIDRNGDGRVDRYETVSDAWGFGGEHEFAFGSDFDTNGDIWVLLGLTGSYTSENLFRGWCLRVRADGTTIPTCSGLRSPGGIGSNLAGDMFYVESQGPWNGSCSLRQLRHGAFMGHPIGNKWYEHAPNMGPRPAEPTGGREGRRHIDAQRIPQLAMPAVVLPYKKMGQSASAVTCDRSEGAFGPYAGQFFLADYTLSLVMRVDLEKVGGQYQGACFPFRESFKTGLIGGILTRKGQLFVSGSSRGWPTRGASPSALQRLHWKKKVPFEVHKMRLSGSGFLLTFTRPVDPRTATIVESYAISTYTHHFRGAYGSPEIDHTHPSIREAKVSADGMTVRIEVEGLQIGHVHELKLPGLRARNGEELLHDVAYYTLNRLK